MEELVPQRRQRRRGHQRIGRCLDEHPGELGQQVLRDPVRLRVGVGEEPRGSVAVEAEGRRRGRHGARRARPIGDPRPDDADDRPLAPPRPGLRADLAALPREPRGARRRLRPCLVQAHPPRHGSRIALPRSRGPGRGAAVAGPRARGRPRADRRRGDRRAQAADPVLGSVRLRAGLNRVGGRFDRSAAATSAAAPTVRASASSRSAAGRPTIRTGWRRRWAPSRESRSPSTAPGTGAGRSRSPT